MTACVFPAEQRHIDEKCSEAALDSLPDLYAACHELGRTWIIKNRALQSLNPMAGELGPVTDQEIATRACENKGLHANTDGFEQCLSTNMNAINGSKANVLTYQYEALMNMKKMQDDASKARASKTCAEFGFKKGTHKFTECLLNMHKEEIEQGRFNRQAAIQQNAINAQFQAQQDATNSNRAMAARQLQIQADQNEILRAQNRMPTIIPQHRSFDCESQQGFGGIVRTSCR